jgi:hypothetical protein
MANRRKRVFVFLVALSLLMIVAVFLLVTMYTDDFDRIAYGMSKDEVRSILGPPRVPNVVWGTDKRLVDLWYAADEKSSILVGYDSDGKVNFKEPLSHGFIATTVRRLRRILGF